MKQYPEQIRAYIIGNHYSNAALTQEGRKKKLLADYCTAIVFPQPISKKKNKRISLHIGNRQQLHQITGVIVAKNFPHLKCSG